MAGEGFETGAVIGGQFRVLKRLGEGGMGAVYLSEQVGIERKVVVKVLHPDISAMNANAIARFRREARAVAQLNHPNILQVFSFGNADNGQLYLAMEFVDGRDLARDIGKGPMSQLRALKIVDQVCAALGEAHQAGIVHRDMKPENVMLSERHGNPDFVKVLDFGIAKLHDGGTEGAKLTQAGAVFGTPRYMSPEQVTGGKVDARSDIYAIGLVLYEMLAGCHPFVAKNAIEYLVKHVNDDIPFLTATYPELGIMPRVESLVMKCLEKNPADRVQSMEDVRAMILECLRDFSEAARGFPTRSPQISSRTTSHIRTGERANGRRTPIWAWLLTGLVLVGGGIGLAMALSSRGQEGQATRGVNAPEDVDKAQGAVAVQEETKEPKSESKSMHKSADKLDSAPETPVPEGPSIDGFPVPLHANPLGSGPVAEVYETPLAPFQVLGFYKAKLHGRYVVKEIPGGFLIEDPLSPFSSVTLEGPQLRLTRNVLLARKTPAKMAPAFDVEFPDGATLHARTNEIAIAQSRLPLSELCDLYSKKYAGIPKVVVIRELEAAEPNCQISGLDAENMKWSAITLAPDKNSPGANTITVYADLW